MGRHTIRLRGHHLLCLIGYRGMGYSADFCVNMTEIYECLRTKQETEIELVTGPDDICKAYPPDKAYHCEGSVYSADQAILLKLGVAPGSRYSWRDLLSQIADRVVPDDISHLCAGCQWESYGVCKEGVRLVNDGQPLPAIVGSNNEAVNN